MFGVYLPGVLFCVGGRGATGDPFKSTECYDVYVTCLVCICQVCCFVWEDEERPVTPSRVQSVTTCMLTVWCVFARCIECYDVYVNGLVCICQVYRVLRRVC